MIIKQYNKRARPAGPITRSLYRARSGDLNQVEDVAIASGTTRAPDTFGGRTSVGLPGDSVVLSIRRQAESCVSVCVCVCC